MISPVKDFVEFVVGIFTFLAFLPWMLGVLALIVIAKPGWTTEELEEWLNAG